jgi:hypothetical protein
MFDLMELKFDGIEIPEKFPDPSLHRPKVNRTRHFLFPQCFATFAQMGGRKKDTDELYKLVIQNLSSLLGLDLVLIISCNLLVRIPKELFPISRPEGEEKIKERILIVLVFEATLGKELKIVINKANGLVLFWWLGRP